MTVRRVVVTGMGIVSSIGNNKQEVAESLKQGKAGITFCQEYADKGFRSQVEGSITIDTEALIDRKIRRFMGDAAAFNYLAMREALADAGLEEGKISDPRIGIIVGSGGASHANIVIAADTLRERGVRKVGPYMVTRTMGSTTSAVLATAYKIKGINYSISSACSTSAHCIGNAVEQIQMGKQDMVFAGGGEEVGWASSLMFDAMGALSSKYNDTPETASRAFDANRDGFVISGGGGLLVLEELEHARARGAKIYAEIVGYGANSDGEDMVAPSLDGTVRCMKLALETVDGDIDYINAHGTSTPVGDANELRAVREVFGDKAPWIGSTKSFTGHALGAAGVNEAIYTLIMMEQGFLAESINITDPDPEAEGLQLLRERKDIQIERALSNSFGFGGTNASLVFQRFKD